MENHRFEWIRRVRSEVEQYDTSLNGDIPQYRKGKWKNVFNETESKSLFPKGYESFFVEHHIETTRKEIWLRALSKSYVNILPSDEQEELRSRIYAIIDEYITDSSVTFDIERAEGRMCTKMSIVTECAIAFKSGAD